MWMQRTFEDTPVMWEPKEDSGKELKRFQKIIEDKYDVRFNDYWEFHRWSTDNTAEFWGEAYDFLEIISSKKCYSKVIDTSTPMDESPEWFPGAELNLAENLLKYRDDHVALILAAEDREFEKVTYAQMYEEAELYAAAFRKLGLNKNDIVVCYMSNRKEAVFAMLAVVSIGAVWTGALPLMGPKPVLDRFELVQPKFLLTVDRFMQSGEEIDMLPKVEVISQGLSSLKKVIIVPSKENSKSKDISRIPNSCFLDEFLSCGCSPDGSVPKMAFEQVPFKHPVFISYTSGTTGKPKPLIHGSGILLTMGIAYKLQHEVSRDSVYLSVSPVGWASWNMLKTLFFLGYTLVLHEGAPFFLTPSHIWDLVDTFRLTTLFSPSTTLDELQKRGYEPQKSHNLSSLKRIMAGGSVVKPQNYDFVYEKIGKSVTLNTAYGCTETMGSALLTEPTLPIRRGEISCPALGNLIEILDDSGKPVSGEIGEISLSRPLPGLALGLWGDGDGSQFREKYFSKYPGKFTPGDYGIVNPITKGFQICGRSDETLKIRNYRFGSSEIYNIVEEFPEVRDSLCVSQYNADMDERAVLFIKVREGHEFNIRLVSRIREAIARDLTISHIPDVILEAKDFPYNLNGKRLESVVKKIINRMPHSTEAVSNPGSLRFFHDIPQLQTPF